MRTRKLLPFILVGSFLVLAGGGLAIGWTLAGDGKKVADRPSPAASPAHSDPGGKSACGMLSDAKQYGAWSDHVLVNNVATAAKASTNADISVTGTLIERRLGYASAAIGKPDQPEMDRLLRNTMEELERQCQRAGL